jgi:hypothetical protein
MRHRVFRVTSFERLGGYRLCVRFDDGAERVIDLKAVLAGPLFGPLRDPDVFGRVALDPMAHTLVWPNGADFDPETLHDWPEQAEEMSALVRRGERTAMHVAEPEKRYEGTRRRRLRSPSRRS